MATPTPAAGTKQLPDLETARARGYRTFLTTVVATAEVHPTLRRITFGAGDLVDFAPVGPDTFLYLLLPPPGRADLTVDRDFSWAAAAEMEESERPVGAYYTLRHWRPSDAQLDIDVVLHDDPGPASSWALTASPGDRVALWGPRTAWNPPDEVDWYLLCADETGLPAVAGVLESLPVDTRAHVFAEVADTTAHQDLPDRPEYSVTWLHRDGAHAGTTTLLADAVRDMDWPDGRPYVWGGGESRAMTRIRRHARDGVGLDRDRVDLIAYWRHRDSPVEEHRH